MAFTNSIRRARWLITVCIVCAACSSGRVGPGAEETVETEVPPGIASVSPGKIEFSGELIAKGGVTVDFGAQMSEMSTIVTLANTGRRKVTFVSGEFRLANAFSMGGGTCLLKTALGPGESCTHSVKFSGTAIGLPRSSLNLVYHDGEKNQQVTLHFVGIRSAAAKDTKPPIDCDLTPDDDACKPPPATDPQETLRSLRGGQTIEETVRLIESLTRAESARMPEAARFAADEFMASRLQTQDYESRIRYATALMELYFFHSEDSRDTQQELAAMMEASEPDLKFALYNYAVYARPEFEQYLKAYLPHGGSEF